MRQLKKLLLPLLAITGIVVVLKSKKKSAETDKDEGETEVKEKIAV